MYSFQIIILAILATRMHLHLWHADQTLHDSDAVMLIPLTPSCLFLCQTYRLQGVLRDMAFPPRSSGLIRGVTFALCKFTLVPLYARKAKLGSARCLQDLGSR
jgi:hypothetical protein